MSIKSNAQILFHLDGVPVPTEIIPIPETGRAILQFGDSPGTHVCVAGSPAQLRDLLDALSNQLGAYEDTLRERGMGFADAFADDEPVVVSL